MTELGGTMQMHAPPRAPRRDPFVDATRVLLAAAVLVHVAHLGAVHLREVAPAHELVSALAQLPGLRLLADQAVDALAPLAYLAALVILVFGPQPVLATKWAWFWMGFGIGPMWALFLVLEPMVVGTTEAPARRRRRLTGGPAFLIAVFVAPVVLILIPGMGHFLE